MVRLLHQKCRFKFEAQLLYIKSDHASDACFPVSDGVCCEIDQAYARAIAEAAEGL